MSAIFFLTVQFLYTAFTLALAWAWRCIPQVQLKNNAACTVRLSVVIVVRNEERNLAALLDSLTNQSYPTQQFDVYLVDDFSTDGTRHIIRHYQSKDKLTIHLLELKDYLDSELPGGNFKKKGIEWAVSQSDAELIVTTDGDCIVPRDWLANLAEFYRHTQGQMICGAVTFTNSEATIFNRLQTIEFASLIGSGAATLQWGLPTMCNAANLAFTRQGFVQVGGYRDTATTATGDDLFLMHKLHQVYPGGIYFLKSTATVVHTQPQETLADFYQQRKRWASKWNLYQDWRVSALAVFIFLSNFAVLAGLAGVLMHLLAPGIFFVGILLRWAAEWLFLGSILHYLNHRKWTGWLLLVQLVYPVYVVFFGLAVHRKGYRWKGRQQDA